jgi:Flp pilus assembly protein CpaB
LHGLDAGPGLVLISLPIVAASAVGAAIEPGDRVDVLAVSSQVRAAASDGSPPIPELLGQGVLVVGLRTDQGTPVGAAAGAGADNANRPTSVLLAVAEADESRYAAAVPTSTFFLALATN